MANQRDQHVINDVVRAAFTEYEKNNNDMVCLGRFRSCQAYVFENERYISFVSYNTMVAFIDKREKRVYSVLRLVYGYSATSAQHIAKFRCAYGADCDFYRYDDRGC